jgi:hypothetical protein
MDNNDIKTFDAKHEEHEQLPKDFVVSFKETQNDKVPQVQMLLNGKQVGDIINDNSHQNDFYRYHDVFHYTFATMLSWSPCTRSMMRKKRKSVPIIDEIEDGARATITEEAISLMLFSEAKKNNLFEDKKNVDKVILRIIKEMTDPFEVREKTENEWENAIIKGYEMFRKLVKNRGGEVHFNMNERKIEYVAFK